MRSLLSLVLLGLVLLAAASAVAAPPPPAPPKFWTVSRCEQTLRAHDYPLPTADGHYFHVGERVCVGAGGSQACEWDTAHRARRFSQFTVFTRSRYIGGVVRSLTLATRAGDGLVPIAHHAGDQYAGWPADFFASPGSVRLLSRGATAEGFRSIVAPIAAALTRRENATGCTGR